MLRAVGFDYVQEVSFGADLTAQRYRALLAGLDGRRCISTSCPAIVGFVERYYPELVASLAPIVSPMVATARVVHQLHGEDTRVVFVGPCIAKKVESDSPQLPGEIDEVLTFTELRDMFSQVGIGPDGVEPSEFDLPHGGSGALYPLTRGALQAADIQEDLMTGEVVSTQGRTHVVEAIREFASGDLGAKLLEVLCCEGCIMGAGITSELPLFNRRRQVREFVSHRMDQLDLIQWQQDIQRFAGLDLSRKFTPNDQRAPVPEDPRLVEIMHRMGKFKPEDELNCGACGYDTCREHAVAIHDGLAESEMCLPYTIEQLRTTLGELEFSHRELATAQEALVQSEKLASMGQLAAGIAHEVNNPLGVVLMYAHLLLDECNDDVPLREDLKMIVEQADRCKKIVGGLLDFARQNKVDRRKTDICELIQTSVHACSTLEAIEVNIEHDLEDPILEVDADQILQVLINLINNAVAAMPEGGKLTLAATGDEDEVKVRVTDSGVGISKEDLKKIFEPFFTTKKLGKGTGLGLSVIYGILKMHSGSISVESNADPGDGPTGTTFTVTIPRKG